IRVRREVRTPLMLTGGLRSAEVMRSIVADRSVDVIGLARPLALEPDLPRRILKRSSADFASRPAGRRAAHEVSEGSWEGAPRGFRPRGGVAGDRPSRKMKRSSADFASRPAGRRAAHEVSEGSWEGAPRGFRPRGGGAGDSPSEKRSGEIERSAMK